MTRYKVRYCALALPAPAPPPEALKAALYAACARRCSARTRALAGRLVEVLYASRASGLCVLRVAHEIFGDVRARALPALGAELGAQAEAHAGAQAGAGREGAAGPAGAAGAAGAVRVLAVSGSMLQLSRRLCPALASGARPGRGRGPEREAARGLAGRPGR